MVTDHQPLVCIFNKPLPAIMSPRAQRWALILMAYQYNTRYRPGKSHVLADAFSCLPLPETVPLSLLP